MTTIIVVVSHEQDARELADRVRATGVPVMGVYSHDLHRDGIPYLPEPEMQKRRVKYKLVESGDWPVKDFG